MIGLEVINRNEKEIRDVEEELHKLEVEFTKRTQTLKHLCKESEEVKQKLKEQDDFREDFKLGMLTFSNNVAHLTKQVESLARSVSSLEQRLLEVENKPHRELAEITKSRREVVVRTVITSIITAVVGFVVGLFFKK